MPSDDLPANDGVVLPFDIAHSRIDRTNPLYMAPSPAAEALIEAALTDPYLTTINPDIGRHEGWFEFDPRTAVAEGACACEGNTHNAVLEEVTPEQFRHQMVGTFLVANVTFPLLLDNRTDDVDGFLTEYDHYSFLKTSPAYRLGYRMIQTPGVEALSLSRHTATILANKAFDLDVIKIAFSTALQESGCQELTVAEPPGHTGMYL